jgi:heme-degrading monooxygenase HmoA
MIKHIVLFKLLEKAEGVGRKENAEQIKRLLDGLPSKIPEIKGYEVGINIFESERAYDIALISVFESKEDLEKYIAHPEHQKAVEFIKVRRQSGISVDYEI